MKSVNPPAVVCWFRISILSPGDPVDPAGVVLVSVEAALLHPAATATRTSPAQVRNAFDNIGPLPFHQVNASVTLGFGAVGAQK
jgi:hypothetical protein